MSKKDFKGGLDSLLGGGRSSNKEEAPARQVPQRLRATAEEPREAEAPKRGRPRSNFREIEKSSQEGCKAAETRATFIVKESALEKIKALAYWERLAIKDVIEVALKEYIERYEKKTGELKPVPKR